MKISLCTGFKAHWMCDVLLSFIFGFSSNVHYTCILEIAKRLQCKSPYEGELCNECGDGYFGEYPNCQSKFLYNLKTISFVKKR